MSRNEKTHTYQPILFDNVLENLSQQQALVYPKINAKPFVKWIGGKRSILDILVERMPGTYTCYNECFVGGGALFFELQPSNAILSDINTHLIITYNAIRDNLEEVITLLEKHKASHDKKYYLDARETMAIEKDSVKVAALFIYLNKTCYNGIYRVNKSGKFNVPMGSYKNPSIFDKENLKSVSKVLQGVRIEQYSFCQSEIQEGAFYYIDPPYHKTFSRYDGSGFGDEEHVQLARFCNKLHNAGCYFMLSNSGTDLIKELYEKFNIEHIFASRSVSCKSNQRGKESELLIRNYK